MRDVPITILDILFNASLNGLRRKACFTASLGPRDNSFLNPGTFLRRPRVTTSVASSIPALIKPTVKAAYLRTSLSRGLPSSSIN